MRGSSSGVCVSGRTETAAPFRHLCAPSCFCAGCCPLARRTGHAPYGARPPDTPPQCPAPSREPRPSVTPTYPLPLTPGPLTRSERTSHSFFSVPASRPRLSLNPPVLYFSFLFLPVGPLDPWPSPPPLSCPAPQPTAPPPHLGPAPSSWPRPTLTLPVTVPGPRLKLASGSAPSWLCPILACLLHRPPLQVGPRLRLPIPAHRPGPALPHPDP